MRFNSEPKRYKSGSLSAKRSVFTLVGPRARSSNGETEFSVKFPAGQGEATENHFTFASCGWGYPPGPPRTEMEDRRATVTDVLQSTTFRLYSSAAAPVTGAAATRHKLPRCQGTKCRPGTPGTCLVFPKIVHFLFWLLFWCEWLRSQKNLAV